MRQALHVSLLAVLVIGVLLPSPGFGGTAPDDATVSTQPLPGGLTAARAAAGDNRHADAGQFLVDTIRRSFQVPAGTRALRRDAILRPLIDHLEMVQKGGVVPGTEGWPLPLTPAAWTQSILGERQGSGSLLAAILRSPSASLMYCALLSLDEGTRAWLASEPALLQHIAQRRAARFLVAAPGVRVRDAAVQVPGGAAAIQAWEAAVGKRVSDPVAFVRAIVDADGAGLSYLLGGAAQLAPERIQLLLALDAPQAAGTSAARRLAVVFDRIASTWDVDEKPFWRPTLDPLLLISDLRLNASGAPVLPGTVAFWTAAFSSGGGERAITAEAVSSLVSGPPADFAWICEQVFVGGQAVLRGPYQLVLLASRRFPAVTAANAADALALLRAGGQLPALVGTLERARVEQLNIYAEAASRARQLMAIEDESRARVALAQFQGALTLVARAAARGTLNPADASRLISSLTAVTPDQRGEYRGKLVEWVAATAAAHADSRPAVSSAEAPAALDWNFVRFVSGADDRGPVVEWEGTPYRVSFGAAEAVRFRRLLGPQAPPYLSAAGTILAAAHTFEGANVTKAAIAAHAEAVSDAAAAVKCGNKADAWPMLAIASRCRELVDAVTRAAKSGDARNAARLAPRLRQLADLLLARGLMVLTYAAALGHPDNAIVSPEDAASRHDFGFDFPGFGRGGAWRWPTSGSDRVRNWHVTGSMLGLDTTLAQFTLARITTRPPSARPSITEEDKSSFIKSAALIHPGTLTAEDHQALIAALRRGRERLGLVRTRAEAVAIGDEIGLPPLTRTLLAWNATVDVRHALDVLTPAHVFLLGLDPAADPARFDAWGVTVEPRSGCQCLQFPARRAGDLLPGRWFTGVLATGFVDLNLRLAELLGEVRMPGALLAPVLAAATSDFTLDVEMRDFDDVSGWSDYTKALDIDRIEQYLAMLTMDGALVPVPEGSSFR